jgi:hypothetical protein
MAPAVPPPALTAERAEKEGRRERRAGGGGDGRSAAAWGCGGRRACRVPMCVVGQVRPVTRKTAARVPAKTGRGGVGLQTVSLSLAAGRGGFGAG